MKEIWLIRHAESTANAGAATSQPATIPLTERGIEQARCVAASFTKQPDLVVLSPYLRAQQTAAPLLDRFPNTISQEWDVQEFTYLAADRCHNTTLTERKPMVAEYWSRSEPGYCDGPGAESFSQFVARTRAMLEKTRGLLEAPTDPANFIAVFTHGQLIQLTMWLLWHKVAELNGQSMSAFHCFLLAITVPNTAIVRLRYEDLPFFSGAITSHLPPNLIT
ncbi:MAG TPA: histidine phosphatase family protein [Pyrinomonadaceae bacterium]|nr:histidine phosphatase family protein [Pyrinomonadaceae bacterium]